MCIMNTDLQPLQLAHIRVKQCYSVGTLVCSCVVSMFVVILILFHLSQVYTNGSLSSWAYKALI